MKFKSLFLICLIFGMMGLEVEEVEPVQTISYKISNETLPAYQNLPLRFDVTLDLEAEPQDLDGCKVVGSISELNTKSDQNLKFEFTYDLMPETHSLIVHIVLDTNANTTLSDDLIIVMDFLVARFPPDYVIRRLNMTHYQEHMSQHNDRSYQLVFFLNGWSNLSLSGSITHAYNQMDMYVIHYMTCLGEAEEMGWIEGRDYVLFQTIILPNEDKIQKFHLYNDFAVDSPDGSNYFYGMKGAESSKFRGTFEPKVNGAKFDVTYLETNTSYGLVLMKFDSQNAYIDERMHQSSASIYMVFIWIGLVVIGGVVAWVFCRLRQHKQNHQLHEETVIQNSSALSETTDKESAHVPRLEEEPPEPIDPITQVDENLQASYNPKQKQNDS